MTGENIIKFVPNKPGITKLTIIPSQKGLKRDIFFNNYETKLSIQGAKCIDSQKQVYETEK